MSVAVYNKIADLNLWLKSQTNDSLYMADIPDLLPLRWSEFKNNWEFIKDNLNAIVEDANDPDFLKEQMDDFSDFIEAQRTVASSLNPFSDREVFHQFYAVFNVLPIDIVPLNNEERQLVDDNILRVGNFVKTDFVEIKEAIIQERDERADKADAADDDYNAVVQRASVASQTSLTIEDIRIMQSLQSSITVIDFILANITSLDKTSVDPFALARVNANNPEIDIQTYASGKLVKFNYGDDLKAIANRFLGDPDKWIDIAIANGLKPPYIDEIGEKIPLIANGSSNQVSIAGTDASGYANIEKVFINQVLLLKSDTEVVEEQRQVINVRTVPISGEIILDLDGELDLDRYTISDDAHIRVFKPSTINSSFYILIPSLDPVDPDLKKEVPWFLQASASDARKAGIDLALDPSGDLIITSTSDLQLQYGLDNAIQAIKLKFAIELGELIRHPEFGFVAVQGLTNVNLPTMKDLMVESINVQIENDERFDRIEKLDIEYLNTTINNSPTTGFRITLVVRLAGSGTNVPIVFTVNVR